MSSIFKGKQALFLDFDGTIGDTFQLHELAFRKTLAPFNIQFDYSQHIGRSTKDVLEEVLAAALVDSATLSHLIKVKRHAANDLYSTHLRFIEGAEAFIKHAHGLGYRLFIGSSGSRKNIDAGIKGLGLEPYIEATITADDVTDGKPNPEIFLRLLAIAQLNAEACLVLEDAPSGLKAALNAGIDVVCIDEGLDPSQIAQKDSIHFRNFAQLFQDLIPVSTK